MHALHSNDEALEIDVQPDEHGHVALPVTFMVRYGGDVLAVGRATYVRVADSHEAIPELLRMAATTLPRGETEEPADDQAAGGTASLIECFHAARRELAAGVGPAAAELAGMLADDVVWHVPGRSPVAGDFRGPAEVVAYLADRHSRAGGAYEIHSSGMLADRRHAVHFSTGSAHLDGLTHQWDTAGVYRIVDDQIAEAWLIPCDQPAFDQIWSASALAA